MKKTTLKLRIVFTACTIGAVLAGWPALVVAQSSAALTEPGIQPHHDAPAVYDRERLPTRWRSRGAGGSHLLRCGASRFVGGHAWAEHAREGGRYACAQKKRDSRGGCTYTVTFDYRPARPVVLCLRDVANW